MEIGGGQGTQLLVMLQGALEGERGEGGMFLGLTHSTLSIRHTASTKEPLSQGTQEDFLEAVSMGR